ncbi:MAG: M60 family metallopeptidase [Marinifilaceae bacterium]
MKKRYTYLYTFILAMSFVAISCEEDAIVEETFIPPHTEEDNTISYPDRLDNPYWKWVQQFPGAVHDTVSRITDYKLTVTPNYVKWSDLRIAYSPEEWYSTGLYAAPSDIVTVNVPSGISGTVKCRIGVWTCKLKDNANRPPEIWKVITLKEGENRIFNHFGGNIYLLFSERSDVSYDFVFHNVLQTADYIYGESNVQEWQERIKTTAAPWAEVRGNKMILTLPVEKLKQMTNPDALLEFYDEFLTEDYDKLWGLTPNNPEIKHRAPGFPWRMTTDTQLCAGAAHAGYPFIASSSWGDRATDLEHMQKSDWGIYHELGHNYQTSTWKPNFFVEVTCNLNVYHMHNRRYNDWPSKDKFSDFEWGVKVWVASQNADKNFSQLYSSDGPYGQRLIAMVTPFIQLAQKYGWKYMTYLNRQSREAATVGGNEERMDFFMKTVTEYAGVNLMPFFNAWGMQASKFAKMYIEQFPDYEGDEFWTVFDSNLIPDLETERTPVIMPEIKSPEVLNTANWLITGSSGRSSDSSADAKDASGLFDGSASTFWISNTVSRPVYTPRPWVEVDMKNPHVVHSTSIRQRNFGYPHVKLEKFKIQYKLNESDEWTDAGEFTTNAQHTSDQSFDFAKPIQARYLRLEAIQGFKRNEKPDYNYKENGAMCLATWGASGYIIE